MNECNETKYITVRNVLSEVKRRNETVSEANEVEANESGTI